MDMKVNSQTYWEHRFNTDWEAFLGKEQSAFFANLLVESFPKWLDQSLKENDWSICDAGCAEGQGTAVLHHHYPKLQYTAIDFSSAAISKAQEYFSSLSIDFKVGDVYHLEKSHDVVVISNVLEHFDEPFEVIQALLEKTKKHLVIMIPFQEYERIHEHFFTFDYKTFPDKLGDFQFTYFKEIDCRQIEGTHWSGKQGVIVYSHKDYVPAIDSSIFIPALKEKEATVEELYQKVEKLEQALSTLEKSREIQVSEKDFYQTQFNEIEEEVNELRSIMLRKENELNYKNHELYNVTANYNQIVESRGWKLLSKYHRLRSRTALMKQYFFKFFSVAKRDGVKKAIQKSFYLTKNKFDRDIMPLAKKENERLKTIYQTLSKQYENNEIKGIVFIPSAFEFDELYNQRVINLAKYLADEEKYGVVYVGWQWYKEEKLKKAYEHVHENIYEIPLFDFLAHQEYLNMFEKITNKDFIITFPAEKFFNLIPNLRSNGFSIIYDIMDEWEEFHKTGDASWFNKDIEEATVLNADSIFVVSEPLKRKFSHLRDDIFVIGNGYYEKVSKRKDIACKKQAEDGRIHIGYFGHMTASWFDWDFVFTLLEDDNVFVHLIGYGASDEIIEKLKAKPNAKYYGKVQPTELHTHVEKWHVGIIPFKECKLSEAVDPIKIYEYLYFGLPTVSTGIPHLNTYPFATHANNHEEGLEAIRSYYEKMISGKGPSGNEEWEKFLEETTWEMRFKELTTLTSQTITFQELYKK